MVPHTQYAGARGERRILCVCPRYTTSCGMFEHAPSLDGERALMPPQGLLVVAAALPASPGGPRREYQAGHARRL
jgi:hopanoid C-2 methylase